MSSTCEHKEQQVKELFAHCQSESDKYQKIIELGKHSPPLEEKYKIPENLVKGCQSRMYLHSAYRDGCIFFAAESDALISSGLATLLVMVYSGETPEVVLKYPPKYLEDLQITSSLTPNRANGLYSMHLRMKQEALRLLVENA